MTCPPGLTCIYGTSSCSDQRILCAPLHLGPCASNVDCGEGTFCNFIDGQCGAGSPGECQPVRADCLGGRSYCYCDGSVSTKDDRGCEGWMGQDFNAAGSCVIPSTSFPCGHQICDESQKNFCLVVEDDMGGTPAAGCSQAVDCDPVSCACLADTTADCGGSCEDGPNGPTITCPPD